MKATTRALRKHCLQGRHTRYKLRNRVPLIVEPNNRVTGTQSHQFYDSFSLLKSLEGAFGLRCLNHACDAGVDVMSDLFGGT